MADGFEGAAFSQLGNSTKFADPEAAVDKGLDVLDVVDPIVWVLLLCGQCYIIDLRLVVRT